MLGLARIAVLVTVSALTSLVLTVSAPASLGQSQIVTMSITKNGEHALPMNIAVRPGEPVVLNVGNYSREFHTFTIPALGVSVLIRPAIGDWPRVTTVRFTARKLHGSISWFCVICPSGNHRQAHPMAGKVYVISS